MRRDPLATVLGLRELAEQRRLAEGAAARQQLSRTEQAHELAVGERARHTASAGPTGATRDLVSHRLTGLALDESVQRAGADATAAEQRADLAAQRGVAAAVARRSVERLLERRAARTRRAARALEVRRCDELAASRWERSR
jgi:flagellar biosynthesis chaperone FliJ